ncbi:hypothetical protein GCM10022223_70310 [Kineosporia mesophila]|uniref:CBM6 domain-containing protein n=1 Tax=Kineosporia mesophila TaxID=566012 RepID=A0ABP7AVG3_9ACTN
MTVNATDSGNTRADVQAVDCPTCAAGSRIAYLAGASGLTVPVNDVAVAGTRTLTILYESDGARDLYVSVNGGADQQLAGLTGRGDWETPAGTTLRITLEKGSNTLLFHNPVGPAPDLDQFSIR